MLEIILVSLFAKIYSTNIIYTPYTCFCTHFWKFPTKNSHFFNEFCNFLQKKNRHIKKVFCGNFLQKTGTKILCINKKGARLFCLHWSMRLTESKFRLKRKGLIRLLLKRYGTIRLLSTFTVAAAHCNKLSITEIYRKS